MNSTRTAFHTPTPWTGRDVYYAARPEFPAIPGLVDSGEAAWRAVLSTASPALCERLRAALAGSSPVAQAPTAAKRSAVPAQPSASVLRADDPKHWIQCFVQPTPAELSLANSVVGYLRAFATSVPRFTLRWFEPQNPMDEEMQRDVLGRTFPLVDPVHVMIRAGLSEPELVGAVVHEAKHVCDAPAARAGMSTNELEARAEAFTREWAPAFLKKYGIATRATTPLPAPDIHPLHQHHVVRMPSIGCC